MKTEAFESGHTKSIQKIESNPLKGYITTDQDENENTDEKGYNY